MIKCPNCGTENKDNEEKCISCGQNIQKGSPNYIFSNNQWMDEETFASTRILRDSHIVYIVFLILACITFFSGFIFLIATQMILISMIIVLSGVFVLFIGIILRNLMQGISITVKNSNKK